MKKGLLCLKAVKWAFGHPPLWRAKVGEYILPANRLPVLLADSFPNSVSRNGITPQNATRAGLVPENWTANRLTPSLPLVPALLPDSLPPRHIVKIYVLMYDLGRIGTIICKTDWYLYFFEIHEALNSEDNSLRHIPERKESISV